MDKDTIEAISEMPIWMLATLTFNLILIAILIYSKQIKSFFQDIFGSKGSSEDRKGYSAKNLMDELIEVKELNRQLAHRIQELEILISKYKETLEIIEDFQTNQNKVFIQGVGLTITLSRNLRLERSNQIKSLFDSYAKFVRKLEYSDRRLTIDLSKTEYINSWAISEITHFFLDVARENGIHLKVICSEMPHIKSLYENLKKLEKQFDSDCAIAILVHDTR